MTGQKLLESLQKLTPDQLKLEVTAEVFFKGEARYYFVERFGIGTTENWQKKPVPAIILGHGHDDS